MQYEDERQPGYWTCAKAQDQEIAGGRTRADVVGRRSVQVIVGGGRRVVVKRSAPDLGKGVTQNLASCYPTVHEMLSSPPYRDWLWDIMSLRGLLRRALRNGAAAH